MGEAKIKNQALTYTGWSLGGCYDIEQPYIEGPPPTYMIIRMENYPDVSVNIYGTDKEKIEKTKEVLNWYYPKSFDEVKDLIAYLDSYYKKTFDIQWHDDLHRRLDKNHIYFKCGQLLFKKKLADLNKLGITETRIEKDGIILEKSGSLLSQQPRRAAGFCETDGKVLFLSDGSTEVYWDYDHHWCVGWWRQA